MPESYSLGIERNESETRRILVNIRTGDALTNFNDRDYDVIAQQTVEDDHSRAIASLPGAGIASPSTMLIRVSDRQVDLLMNSRVEAGVPNLVSPIRDAILPGFLGYVVRVDATSDAEALGFRIRETCDAIRAVGVPVRRFVLMGKISDAFAQTLANVLAEKIRLVVDDYVSARGAAILAAIRSKQTIHAHQSQLIHSMAPHRDEERTFRPQLNERRRFDELYRSRASTVARYKSNPS
jgi:hypothetical protein